MFEKCICSLSLSLSVCTHIYIYIYIHILSWLRWGGGGQEKRGPDTTPILEAPNFLCISPAIYIYIYIQNDIYIIDYILYASRLPTSHTVFCSLFGRPCSSSWSAVGGQIGVQTSALGGKLASRASSQRPGGSRKRSRRGSRNGTSMPLIPSRVFSQVY